MPSAFLRRISRRNTPSINGSLYTGRLIKLILQSIPRREVKILHHTLDSIFRRWVDRPIGFLHALDYLEGYTLTQYFLTTIMIENKKTFLRTPFGQIHTWGKLTRIVRPIRDRIPIETDFLTAVNEAVIKPTSTLVGHRLEGCFQSNIDLADVVLKRDLRGLFVGGLLRLLQVITTRPKRKKSHSTE